MENRWSDLDAEAAIERYTKQGINLDVALRTYSSRLLGAEPKLVIHGGGNTSVKTTMRTRFDEDVEVICVKGSGWDMARIEPAGLPAVRLAPLQRLADLDAMTDEEMVDYQRANLIHPGAPNPSIETLLHAFLPHKYIDHTHANAVLALTDQPHGESMCRQVYGDAHSPRSLRHAGLRARQESSRDIHEGSRSRRHDSAEARRLHLRRDGPPSL